MIIATIICILSPILPISTLMNIVGSIICYFFIYLIPTWMHFRCLYPLHKTDDSLLEDNESSLVSESKEDDTSTNDSRVCAHNSSYVEKRPKMARYVLYGLFNVVGVAIGIYGVYQTIQDIISG